jgi:hypothetical protein
LNGPPYFGGERLKDFNLPEITTKSFNIGNLKKIRNVL